MVNKSSGELINYTLRPKKQIERKLLVNSLKEIFWALPLSNELSKYRYVGMGSIYYYDFILFHRYLHIQKMTSLDKHWTKRRFEFNRPYDFITFQGQETMEFVRSAHFKEPMIVWFDYDYMLYHRRQDRSIIDSEILQELQLLQNKVKKYDVIIITVNVKYPGDNPRGREELDWICNKLKGYLPPTVKTRGDISEGNYTWLVQQIIINCLSENQKFKPIKLKKIFSFSYSDGAPMYTFGAIACDKEEEIDALKLQYVSTAVDDIITIDVPNLTIKEKIYLDSEIVAFQNQVSSLAPHTNKDKALAKALFEFTFQDLENYVKWHKYYPQYFESLL